MVIHKLGDLCFVTNVVLRWLVIPLNFVHRVVHQSRRRSHPCLLPNQYNRVHAVLIPVRGHL